MGGFSPYGGYGGGYSRGGGYGGIGGGRIHLGGFGGFGGFGGWPQMMPQPWRQLPQQLTQPADTELPEPQPAPSGGVGFQPNYSMFWNPMQMLQQGNPFFGAPWYQQTAAPPPQPPPQMEQQPARQPAQGVQLPRQYQGYFNPQLAMMAGVSSEDLANYAQQRYTPRTIENMLKRRIRTMTY